MRPTLAPAIAANRYGLGARPGDLATIRSDPRGWLIEQLGGEPPRLDAPDLRTSADILADTLRIRRERRELKRAAAKGEASAAQLAAAQKIVQLYRHPSI